MVLMLLEHGAEVDAENLAPPQFGTGRDTPLHEACAYNRPDVVRILVGHGADVNKKNDIGNTPLSLGTGDLDIMSVLLEAGAEYEEGVFLRLMALPLSGMVDEVEAANLIAKHYPEEIFNATMTRLTPDHPLKGKVLEWFRDNYPEWYFRAFCEEQQSRVGGMAL